MSDTSEGCFVPMSAMKLSVTDPAPDRMALAHALAGQGYAARAHALALELHEAALLGADEELAADSADCLGKCCIMLAKLEQGVGFARLAREIWRSRRDAPRQSRSGGQLAFLLASIGEPEALTEAQEALHIAEACGDPNALIWALLANCLTLVLLKQPDRAIPFGERALECGDHHGAASVRARLGLSEAVIWVALGRQATETPEQAAILLHNSIARAVGLTREALALARKEGDGWLERLMINNIAEYSLYGGDTDTAEASLAEFAFAAGEPTIPCRTHHLLVQGRLHRAKGRYQDALETLAACRALAPDEDLELATMCQIDLTEVHEKLGSFEAALAAHRAYHDLYVRRASEAAERRARLWSLRREAEQLRAEASQAQALATNLTANNAFLAREAERLMNTSLEDPLTGLANRRRLDVAFLDLLTSRAPFALAMIDVDHFKQVNDRFSHPMGDAVLRAIAQVLAGGARQGDLAIRYGGEEFALLLRDADLGVAEHVCERVRESVRHCDWEALCPGLAVTISIGVAASPEAATHEALLALADRRLYLAKQAGRNRVVSRDGLVA